MGSGGGGKSPTLSESDSPKLLYGGNLNVFDLTGLFIFVYAGDPCVSVQSLPPQTKYPIYGPVLCPSLMPSGNAVLFNSAKKHTAQISHLTLFLDVEADLESYTSNILYIRRHRHIGRHETTALINTTIKLHMHYTIWAELLEAWLALTSVKYHDNLLILMLLNQWLALTSVKYHDNLLILMLLNQWLALTMLRTTGPCLVSLPSSANQRREISGF